MSDILVIGSLNADLVVRAPRFPRPGETLRGGDLQIIPGGKGANQAVAAARQGARAAMAGRIGKDSFGPFLKASLDSNGVETDSVLADDCASGTAIIVVDAGGQNSIVLSPGANGRVTPGDVDALDPQARILLLQLEIPIETVMHAAEWGKSRGMTVILNPAPARDLPDALLRTADYLLPNESELALLSGLPIEDLASAERAARVLIRRGAPCLIVTLGGNGALIVEAGGARHSPAFRVDVVDTTASGDAFIGGFASSLLQGRSLEGAVRHANACGALAASRFGAQPSLPTREETERFLAQREGS